MRPRRDSALALVRAKVKLVKARDKARAADSSSSKATTLLVETVVRTASHRRQPQCYRVRYELSGCWARTANPRSEEHTSELQSRRDLVCRLLLEKKKKS